MASSTTETLQRRLFRSLATCEPDGKHRPSFDGDEATHVSDVPLIVVLREYGRRARAAGLDPADPKVGQVRRELAVQVEIAREVTEVPT